jgi:predicted O-linked N-acetylglucosamine transferase (SPINDLY family)
MIQQELELGMQHHQAARLDEAEASYRLILQQQPDHPEALHLSGVVAYQRGNVEEGERLVLRALQFEPNNSKFLSNLGLILAKLGKLPEAVAAYRKALEASPDLAETHFNLGLALQAMRITQAAMECYSRAVALRPQWADAHFRLATMLLVLRVPEKAIQSYCNAVAADPNHARAWNDLGCALQSKERYEEAIAAHERALAVRPDFAEAMYNLALAYRGARRLNDAADALRKAVQIRPDFPDAWNNLANAMKNLGELDEAIQCYKQTLGLHPDFAEAHSNLVLLSLYSPDRDAASIKQDMVCWNDRHAAPLARFIRPYSNDRSPDRRLRIGYVSPDFCGHIVGLMLYPLFYEHDPAEFEVYCYANLVCDDWLTNRFRRSSRGWHDIRQSSDEEAAELVRSDRIDILVDLAGHTANNRLRIFAQKPAPIQVTFGGYPGGTGMSTMDYHFTDPYLDPKGLTESHYVEKLVRMDGSFWCYEPQLMQTDGKKEVLPLPAVINGYVTFGCLNNFCKMNDGTLAAWGKVLTAVADSRLLMMVPPGPQRQRIVDKLAAQGIDPQRIEFVPYQSRQDYLDTYNRIDLVLDTLPYNGHTTTLDAMWMGVPVITRIGSTAVGRAGLSHLHQIGLSELAAENDEQFVAIASRLAADWSVMVDLRATLRQRMLKSPLTDSRRFARNVESAYRQIWRQWCQATP